MIPAKGILQMRRIASETEGCSESVPASGAERDERIERGAGQYEGMAMGMGRVVVVVVVVRGDAPHRDTGI